MDTSSNNTPEIVINKQPDKHLVDESTGSLCDVSTGHSVRVSYEQ